MEPASLNKKVKSYKKRLAILFKSYILMSLFFVANVLAPAEQVAYPLGSWKYKENENITNLALDRALKLVKGSLINDRQVSEVLDKIKTLYKSKGYSFVQLNIEKDISPEGEMNLVFSISEGKRVKIDKVFFEGNLMVPSGVLMDCLENKSGLFGKKIFNEQAVSEDVNRINQYYLKNGLQGSVVQIRKDFFNRNENVNLTYCIEECAEENRINDLTEAGVDQNPFEKKETEKSPARENSQKVESKVADGKRNFQKPEIKKVASDEKIKSAETNEGLEKVLDAKGNSEIKHLKELLKGREEVETLLSNMLTAEKDKSAKIIQENSELKDKVRVLEERLLQQSKTEQELKDQLEKKSVRENELMVVKNGAEKKLKNVNALITTKLKDIEKIKDQLQSVLTDTADAIAKELDRVELQEVTITPPREVIPVEPEKQIEKPQTEQTVKTIEKKILQGKVLVVNMDLNFIVFNIGAETGSSKGKCFTIEREGKAIGKCRVIEARKNISAADIIEKTAPVKTGDDIYEQN